MNVKLVDACAAAAAAAGAQVHHIPLPQICVNRLSIGQEHGKWINSNEFRIEIY